MKTFRVLVAVLGGAAAIYGAVLLADQGAENFVQAGSWLVGGVVLHDGVLGPLVIIVSAVAARLLRGHLPGVVVAGGIVLGSVTLVAIPVLGRFGARPDNPSLLPRNYVGGWWALAALTLVVLAVSVLLDRRSSKGGADGARTGG